MRIGVFLRGVIELEGLTKNEIKENSSINIFDQYALEEALRIKSSTDDVTITCILADKNKDILYKALALNVDDAIQINVEGMKTIKEEANCLKNIVQEYQIDLLLSGVKESSSGEFGLVGYCAEQLEYQSDWNVTDINVKNNEVYFQKITEHNGNIEMKINLPAALSVGKGIYTLRHANLKGVMAAKKKNVISYVPSEENEKYIKFENLNRMNNIKESQVYELNETIDMHEMCKIIVENVSTLR